MDKFEGLSVDGERKTSGTMTVALIAESGAFETMWLPAAMEGRYRFRAELPLYIEPNGNQWVAYAEKEAFFQIPGEKERKRLLLTDQMIAQFHFHGLEYAIYTETNRPGDNVFLPYYLEERLDYTIGRNSENEISYPNDVVSRRHAILHWDRDAWSILDCGSTNGTYVNGRRVREARLSNGDIIYIMGLYILMGSGFVSMNNFNDRIRINTPRIRRILGENDVFYPQCPMVRQTMPLFNRQPRKKIAVEPEPIEIESPPMPLTANKIPLLLRLGSPMVMGGRALVTGNMVMALTSLVFPALTQGLTEKDRKEYEAKRLVVYRSYLSEKERQILQEKEEEERLLDECYPELSSVLSFSASKDRLWERQNIDDDFLNLRVGAGQIPLIAERQFQQRSFKLEPDVLEDEMYDLAERPVWLKNAPIMLSLKEDYITGVLGFSKNSVGLLRNMVMQLVLTHSYDEVKLVLLAGTAYSKDFDFVRYLPHNWDNERSIRFFAVTHSDTLQISEYLSKEIEQMLDEDQRKRSKRDQVAYVVMALSKELFDCVESLKGILSRGEYVGVSVIAAFEGIPKECSRIIDLQRSPKLVSLASAGQDDQRFDPDYCDELRAYSAMREIMGLRLMLGSQAYALPNMMTFLEMFGAGRVEHLTPLRRWAENNPVKSLSVPIGVGTDGRLFTLDLHETRQGPHGLVAGMTGSGKSEFLITYILSMAVNFSPDEVAFILIDYKGGGLADAFENKERGIHLPHLVGTITNLDGDSIDRSLMSIKSELTRRQTIFKDTKQRMGEGTLDIYDYQKLYRSKKVDEPLPHLFIISDEFAELKQQQPTFMDELISAARIGRSLGVHLILATQKPGGVVNDQIWSNTKFRACLRVQDRGDSMEMLKRPEAAELKHTGRFYLQVGYNEYFAMGQSAWCGADYVPQDQVAEEKDDAVQFLDNVGQTIHTVKPDTERQNAESRQIVAVVNYLSNLARREQIQPRRLWTDPLASAIELESLIQDTPKPQDGITAILGTVDDPEFQRQFPLYLNLLDFHNMLLVGFAGSGKSTFLRTLLYSLSSWYTPAEINYYIVDLSDGALSSYKHLPHCGAYLTEKETASLGRLMDLVNGIIARRKMLFAQAEVSSFEAYCKIQKIPLILFIIDGYTKMKNVEGGENFFVKLPDYLREGSSYGVRFFVTCNHLPEVGFQSKQEFDGRITLQAKDHYEYTDILDVRCKASLPEVNGRGMCVQEGRALAYQAAMLDCDRDDQERISLLRERLKKIAERDKDIPPAICLPMIDEEQTYENFCRDFETERIPLGYAARDMKPIAIPFQQLYGMSLYFGNPKGVKPVFQNLLAAARRNGMDVIVVRREAESVFDEAAESQTRILGSTAEGLTQLAKTLMAELIARNVYRDEYSVQQGIPLANKGRAKKAAKYIRAHSVPILVVIESFADFCRVKETAEDGELQGQMMFFLSGMRGYNIYFAAGFYPNDGDIANHPLLPYYNQDEFLLLSGGRYDKCVIRNIPYQVSKFDRVDPAYNQFLMKYQDAFHPLIMPCGKLREETGDPDESPIL